MFIAYCVGVSKYRYCTGVKSSIDDHFLNDINITQLESGQADINNTQEVLFRVPQ